MNHVLNLGVLILSGYLGGELAEKIKLPKVSGYLLAGIMLNPRVFGIMPGEFIDATGILIDILLALITFSVGGTLAYKKIKALGRAIVTIALLEAQLAFVMVAVGCYFVSRLFFNFSQEQLLAFSLLLGSLASPTDPAATIAVMHEYKSRGPVSLTIMGVAVLDDALALINFSFAVNIALAVLGGTAFSPGDLIKPCLAVIGSIITGAVFGFLYISIARRVRARKQDEAVLIAVLISVLLICFGTAKYIEWDSLLATMAVGVTVANFSPTAQELFIMVDRYIEELVFILFFTISGMHLDFTVLLAAFTVVSAFVIFRAAGKFTGVQAAAALAGAPETVRKYAVGGLIPQGGIVIGLALVAEQYSAFAPFSRFLVSAVIGATVIHEIIGPVISKMALKKSGEIPSKE